MGKPKILITAFGGKYKVGKNIGNGANGSVYAVKNEEGSDFAAKVLTLKEPSLQKKKRFHQEFAFCATFVHDNVIRTKEYGLTDDDLPFIIMPKYEGSLRKILRELSEDDALRVYLQILDGVQAAHLRGVIHRDLKPENILYDNAGEVIVVSDFGIASFTEEELHTAIETKAQERLANFQYAAPEQRNPDSEVTKSADIYSLGLILNELFTGKLAHGQGYETIGPESEYSFLNEIVEKMLQQSPEKRYESIRDLKSEIRSRGLAEESVRKINALKGLAPKASIQDPLIENPVEVHHGNWANDVLTIELTQEVNGVWVGAWINIKNYEHFPHIVPGSVRFKGRTATISGVRESLPPQKQIDLFKSWLILANAEYKHSRIREAEGEEHQRIQNIKDEEKRAEVNKNLKF